MKILAVLSLSILCCSCSAWPQFFQAAETIATDTAIKIEVSKEAIQQETDLDICINITNQPEPPQRPARKDK